MALTNEPSEPPFGGWAGAAPLIVASP